MCTFLRKNNCFQWLGLFGLLVSLSSCATDGVILPQTLPEPSRVVLNHENNIAAQKDDKTNRFESLASLPVLDANHSPKQAAESLTLPKGKLTLNADALPLSAFVHLALGDVLQLAFEMDAEVAKRKDPVTMHISKGISADRLLGMVEESLAVYDVVLLRGKHGLRVVSKSTMKTLPPAVFSAKSVKIRSGQVAEIIPLTYVKMSELQFIIGSLFKLGKYGNVTFNERLNAMMAVGDADRVARLREFVTYLDRPSFKHRKLRLVRPIYWQAEDLSAQLIKMLKAQGVPATDHADASDALIVLPMKQINALFIASPSDRWMDEITTLIRTLDKPLASGSGSKTFIYFARYRSVGELGNLISSVLGSPSSLELNKKGVSAHSSGKGKNTKVVDATNSSIKLNKAKGLNVVVDKNRGALIFIGTSTAYQQIVPILKRLDIPARQVLIEMTVADVSLDDSNQLGVEWQFTNVNKGNALTGILGTIGGLGVGAGGLTYALADAAGNVRAKLNALASKGKAKILSSPTLLAMDGEKAHMQVGTQISVVSQDVSNVQAAGGNNTSLLRSYRYVDTGVILDISPTITSHGSIRMKLRQEVSQAGAAAVNSQPPISTRIVDTVMVAESGQTVLLGGLITHNQSKIKTQVPLLGDIPILGALFRSETISDSSTELIILITPHLVSNSNDAAELTDAYRKRLGW